MSDLDAHLGAIQDGDLKAFSRWVAAAEPLLRAQLRPFATSVDAEAVMQESLLRIWQIAPKVEPDGQPNGLLRVGLTILKNLAISEARKVRPAPLDPLWETPAPPALPDPLLVELIRRCKAQLPDKPRAALELRLSRPAPDAELARALGMKTNTFLQNITRARKLLQACLLEHGVEL